MTSATSATSATSCDEDYEDDVNLLEPFFGFPFPSFCHAQLFVELVDVNYTRR
jgi:hypothetical protein